MLLWRPVFQADPPRNEDQQTVHGGASRPLASQNASTAVPMVGKKPPSPKRSYSPKRLSLAFTGSFNSAKQSSMPAPSRLSSNPASASPAVTSTLVTGSAVTTTWRTLVGEASTAASILSWNSSALAKNSGASQRKSRRPGISWASG